jgi:integrase
MTDGRRGSVKQAANGTWYLIVDIGSGPERRQTRRRGFPTKKAAQSALTGILGALEDQIYVAPKNQTLTDFLTMSWLPAIEQTVKPGTFESYRRNIRVHVQSRPIGRIQLQKVDARHLNSFYAQMLAGDEAHRKLSARSVQYVATILHRAFRDAIRWQAIVRNPADSADPPKSQPKPEMKIWSAAELGKFLAGIADDRLLAAWWLLATTGMRRGEVLGLRWADVDLSAGLLRISRTLITSDVRRKGDSGMSWGTPKTAKGRRSVALDETTVTALKAHRAVQLQERMAIGSLYGDQDLVVCLADGSPVHPKTLSYTFGRRAQRLGLPKIRLHDLRHTHATLALRAGVHPRVVQERLGHANVGITLDTYSHVDLEMQAAAAALVSALVAGTSL